MHSPITNVETQVLNESRWGKIKMSLLEAYLSMFKWKNLPYADDIANQVSRRIAWLFCTCQYVGAYDTDYGLVLGSATPGSAVTWYNGYMDYQITTPVDSVRRNISECCIERTWLANSTFMDMIEFYTTMIYQCERAIFVNLQGQNTPLIMEAPKGMELTYSNAYEQIAGHKPVIYGREGYRIGDEVTMHYFQPAPYVSGSIMDLRSRFIAEYYNKLGLPSNTEQKRERLTAAESSLQNGQVALNFEMLRRPHMEMIDAINNKFSYNIELEVSVNNALLHIAALENALDITGELEGGTADVVQPE